MPRFLLLITFLLLSLVGFFPVYLSFTVNWYICFFSPIKLHVNISILFFLKGFLLSFLCVGFWFMQGLCPN
ncbi:hypothetical protein Peur_005925 [Populus x canadensis]